MSCSIFHNRIGINTNLDNDFFHLTSLQSGLGIKTGSEIIGERCRRIMLEEMSVVTVFVAPNDVTQVVRTKRVTFSSQLATLGTYSYIIPVYV